MKIITKTSGLLSILGILLLGIALSLLCAAFHACNWRLDCTAGKIYTLSDTTKQALANLPQEVEIHYYYSRDLARMPVRLKNYAGRVEDLLREYENASKGKIRIIKRNPQPDTDAEDAANLDGVTPQTGAAIGSDAQLYFGLAVVCGVRKAALPFLDPERETLLEYDLTRALQSVTVSVRHKIGVMSSLKLFGGLENASAAMAGRGGMAPSWTIIGELKKQYPVVPLKMDVTEIPAEVDILMVVHPGQLTSRTEFALDQFVLQGGRLLLFLDPLCLAELQERARAGKTAYMVPDAASAVPRLLSAWGITFTSDNVVLDRSMARLVRTSAQRPPEHLPNVLSLKKEHFASGDSATAQLASLVLLNSGAFQGKPMVGLTKTVLLHTTEDSQLVEPYATQRTGADMMKAFASDKKEKELAIRLVGEFPSAFPDGIPVEEGNKQKSVWKGPILKKSAKPGVVVLVGDADMLFDPFCVQQANLMGRRITTPLNNNLDFVQNVIEGLAGESSLFAIRTRGETSRPFSRVQALEKKSAEKYREEILKFEKEVQGIRRELFALQREKERHGSGKDLLNRSQKEAIKRIRQREAEARRKLKDLRKEQRRDVEQLENHIMLANLVVMPLLVTLGGLTVGMYRCLRRNRRGKK